MYLRKAEKGDLAHVIRVLEEGREAIAALGIDQWQQFDRIEKLAEGDIERGESYVLVEGNEIIGTCMISDRREPTYDVIYEGKWLTDTERYLTVHRIAVSHSARGSDAASFIISEALRIAAEKGLASVRIDTHRGNARMRRFLAKCGFTECGIIMLDDKSESTLERIGFERIAVDGPLTSTAF